MKQLITTYRFFVSPLLGHCCRFYPSCSAYAQEAFETKNFFFAALKTTTRILKCHPFHAGGYDPLNTLEKK